MSRFFATGSDSESESSSSGEEEIQKPTVVAKFQWSDEEDEGTKRVVRSAKDKRFDDLRAIIKTIKNHKKIKDMANILDDFDDLGRAFDKAKKVVDKEGLPRFYVRCISELEDFTNECWEDREGRKQMSKNNAKCLTTLRQKIRRYNRDFETEITAYRESPDTGEEPVSEPEDEGSESESDDERQEPSMFLKDNDIPAKVLVDDDDSDSDLWGEDSEHDTSSSEDEGHFAGQLTADYFRKKTPADAAEAVEKKKKKEEERKKKKVPTATLR